MIQGILIGVQVFFSCVIGIYFLTQLKQGRSHKETTSKDCEIKMNRLQKLRKISLTEPLSEKFRPKSQEDIIGQKEALEALKIALCTPNPQHILIYGNPGVGKTAAARIILEMAKKEKNSPFNMESKFIEIDATTLRFDERSVADPLIGSVHDPIYQGAGAYGQAGIPQPKEGAVTKAHGGILFIDEIGELHGTQMNKLLKVLEDRKVYLESSYYSPQDSKLPHYIHEVFKRGLPADFRLIGATTRSREEIPPALRSRCVEIFFNDLSKDDIIKIVDHITEREMIKLEAGCADKISHYVTNGRDAVNLIQTTYNKTLLEQRSIITLEDIEWVIQTGHYEGFPIKRLEDRYAIGKVNGLGVSGHGRGMVLEIQTIAHPVAQGKGTLKVTGIIEEEEIKGRTSVSRRKSMVHASVENVMTLIQTKYDIALEDYYVHIHFPSGIPVDGPSAGVGIFIGLYSALFKLPIHQRLAFTGEVTLHGEVYPVGGVKEKVEAAKEAGAQKVIIPKDNMSKQLSALDIKVIPVMKIEEVIKEVFEETTLEKATKILHA